jgi:NADH-quinone oxidoreductase subunit H
MDLDLLLGIGRFVLATTLLLLLTVPTAFVIIYLELKVIALMQLRYGPNRVGPGGIFQSAIHGFKVLAKEDTVPDQADRGTFTLAPWMVYMAAAMSMLVIPFAPGAIAANFNIGIVYFFAVLGLSGVGLLVAGWASYNKYSLLGGLRAASQMVSYEVGLGVSLIPIFMLAGNVTLTQMIWTQQEELGLWFALPLGLAFFLFMISAFAEAAIVLELGDVVLLGVVALLLVEHLGEDREKGGTAVASDGVGFLVDVEEDALGGNLAGILDGALE